MEYDNIQVTSTLAHCSFCGKSRSQTIQLTPGPGHLFVCNECVASCREMIEQRYSLSQWREWQKEKYHIIALPNGKPIDLDMLEIAMEDSDLAHRYFLNLVTGEVVFLSDYLGLSDEEERLLEAIDGSNDYVAIERIPSHVAYQWMVDFVNEMVAPADESAAEQLSRALQGKGAFHRFKETLHRIDEQWLQAWYQWRERQLRDALNEWLESVL